LAVRCAHRCLVRSVLRVNREAFSAARDVLAALEGELLLVLGPGVVDVGWLAINTDDGAASADGGGENVVVQLVVTLAAVLSLVGVSGAEKALSNSH